MSDPAPITAPSPRRGRLRAPWTLWRYLGADVWKLLLLTAASLVMLIAFAGSIKPLADGQIGLADALTLTLLLVVPMLQFALPFAAGFAATIGYHRFAADNEASAALAGGISYRALLIPALVTGLILAAALAALANQVIPSFLRSAERIVTRDATRVFVTPIERGESIKIGDLDIHAGSVLRLAPDPATGAVDHLVMTNVLAVQARDGGWMSARQVDLWVFETPGDDEGGTAVQLVFTSAVGDLPGLSGAQEKFWTQRILIPGAFRDDPKFLTFAELVDVRKDPRRMSSVRQRMARLASRLAEHATLRDLRDSLARTGRVTLQNDGARLTVLAGGLEKREGKWTLLPRRDNAPVTVTITRAGGFERAQHAQHAWIEIDQPDRLPTPAPAAAPGATPPAGTLRLELERVTTIGESAGGEAEGERTRQAHSGLRTSTDHLGERLQRSSRELLAEARDLVGAFNAAAQGQAQRPPELTDDAAKGISTAARNLRNRIADVRREIDSKLHERIAYAVACLIMVLTGAVVAIRLRDSLPLPVYLWSFFPALVAVITISAGQTLAHSAGPAGLPLLWGGVLGLAIYTLTEYQRLTRH